ncbi:MAG: hypothetical protein ACRC7O_08110, partial [Fimbriiglobus sp.]
MPLRDHFHPPLSLRHSWEAVHLQLPGAVVARLNAVMPEGYLAEGGAHIGSVAEVDIGGFQLDPDDDWDRPADGG